MSTSPTTRLRFRWTKGLDRWGNSIQKVDRDDFALMVRKDEDEWEAVTAYWPDADRDDNRVDRERTGFATEREAKLWAESQVDA